jgi:DNA polymerase III delta prime subunit
MPEILSLELRPRTLSGLVGQEKMVAGIRKQMNTRPPRTWLFHGSPGTGKTTTMEIMAVAYQCDHMKLWGDPCIQCWVQRDQFAIHKFNGSGEASKIEELREVVALSRYKPTTSPMRVLIVDEAQGISAGAMKILLEPTERPPATTVWIFGSSEPSKLPEALRRRCTTYQLKALGIDAVEAFLKKVAAKHVIQRPLGPLFEQIHLMQVRAPGVLLQALEKYAAGADALDAVTGSGDGGVNTYALCKAVTDGDWKKVSTLLQAAQPEQARLIRATVAGWLIGGMKKSIQLEKASLGILDLTTAVPFDDATMLQWLWATLYKITKRYHV